MPATLHQLDTRRLPASERRSSIVAAIDALPSDGSLILVAEDDPRPLLRDMTAETGAGYRWSVLELGPERYRVEIRGREGPRTVTEFLETDHQRLDGILQDVVRLSRQGDDEEAAERFAEFECGLGWHIDVEEEVLFPAFETNTGSATGPTVLMRTEHVAIRELLTACGAALAGAGDVERSVDDLEKALSAHNLKEEQVLYPVSDHVVGGEEEREALVGRIQAF
ncbi:MAG: hemerythrin domain-containing protein [Chloroflexi bacterium]|nr:hemerythrin domain-containing protein [Chloroflexota bacterium]